MNGIYLEDVRLEYIALAEEETYRPEYDVQLDPLFSVLFARLRPTR